MDDRPLSKSQVFRFQVQKDSRHLAKRTKRHTTVEQYKRAQTKKQIQAELNDLIDEGSVVNGDK